MIFEIIINTLSVIFLFLFFLTFTYKINNFLDIKKIIYDYLKMFNGNYLQLILIYIMPIVIAIKFVLLRQIDTNMQDKIDLIITIFTSMFFAFIGILSTNSSNDKIEDKKEIYIKVLKETINAIIFEIFMCLIILLISFLTNFFNNKFMSFLYYYLFIVILMNVLLILKRIKGIFDINLKKQVK